MRKKTGNKLHTWEAALLLAVAAALLWGACTLQRQDALEQKVIRLHVIANSDSEADQALKLRVRDRVLVLAEDILRQSRDMEEARQRLAEALPQLQQTAAEEIAAQGSRYTVSAGLEETEFPTREYDGFALPSGEYLALRVDVYKRQGYGQLDWKLRSDPRVVCMERTNARYLTPEQIPDPLDFASIDVSFISLKLIFPALYGLLRQGGEIACLIKPQFEAGREKVGKKGVVRDPAVHQEVLEHFLTHAKENHFTVLGITYSPIRGPEGNIEYLGYLKKCDEPDGSFDLPALVAESHSQLKD